MAKKTSKTHQARSAVTGKFVSLSYANKHKSTTVVEKRSK